MMEERLYSVVLRRVPLCFFLFLYDWCQVLGRCLKMLFNTKDVSQCKAFVQRQCVKILQGKVNLQDLIMAREYRGMATYKPTASVPCLQLTK